MATGMDVIEGLRRTGTGEAKLKVGLDFLERNKNASGLEVIEAMRTAGVSPVTLAKADRLAGGTPLSDLLPPPPKHMAEQQEEKDLLRKALVKLAGTHEDNVKDKSPKLEKPSAAR